jgi:ribosomal protein S1
MLLYLLKPKYLIILCFFQIFEKVNARLIAVDPATKIMRLSLLPHILSLTAPELGNTRIGDIVENARVIRLDQGVGALLAFPVTEDNQVNKKENDLYQAASKISCAYVHISKAFDNKSRTPEALFAKKFSMNNVIPKLRILSKNNWMDNIASCATAEDIVSAAVLTHRDLQPGRIYKALPVLANLDNGGVLVQLGNDVKGLIPEMHLFDKSMSSDSGTSSYRNKIRSTKYKVGNKIDVRCLLISPAERKCMLTAKKSLLSSDMQNPITDYSEIEKGRIATGYVSGVSKLGIAITFYNNVFGRVSARKLAEDMGVEDPTSDYNVGDVVKAKVRRCFKKNNDELRDSYILDLTLNLLSESNETTDIDTNTTQLANLMKPGMILKAKSMKIVELVPSKVRDSDSAFFPGHALVTVKCKHLINDDCENIKGGSLNFKLPYDHILDSHLDNENQSANSMDALASKVFTIGKKIAQEAVILSTTNRNGSLSLIVSLKPDLVATAKENALKTKNNSTDAIMPTPTTALFMGAYVRGYCVRLHPNYGAFIRFLGGLTAIIPKLKGGLNVGLYDTVLCKIIAMDVMNGKAPKILLKQVNASKKSKIQKGKEISANRIVDFVKPGDIVGDVKIDDINFARATVTILDEKFADSNVKARIHMTMANSLAEDDLKMPLTRMVKDDLEDSGKSEKITKFHPFCSWEVGKVKTGVICVAIDVRDGITYLELANRNVESKRLFFEEPRQLSVGTKVSGVITAIAKQNKGLWTQICPGITGFVPGLELSDNVEILNNLSGYFKVGGRVDCCVVRDTKQKGQFKEGVRLSILAMARSNEKTRKPLRGDSMVGRVNRFITQQRAPSLMIELSGGYLGRCDITELEENDDWENMPLGRLNTKESGDKSQDDAIEDEDEVDNAKGR